MAPYPIPVAAGTQFGKWTVVRELDPIIRPDGKGKIRLMECRCTCGEQRPVRLIHLKGGRSTGCHRCVERNGYSGHGKNPNARYVTTNRTYRIYRGMIARCTYPSASGWKNYGGRGIDVCKRWREDYSNFLEDMGEAPNGESIDRIDSDGNYELSNCRWATNSQQANNTKRNIILTFNGVEMTMSELSSLTGIDYQALRHRIRRKNLSPEEAVKCVLEQYPHLLRQPD